MTTAPITQVTAPMPTRRGDGPALPTRKPLTLARVRRARRRVTHLAAAPRTLALTRLELVTGGAAVFVAGIVSVAWMGI